MESFLHIPMQISPTRQKLWRVLRFAGIVLGAWSVVTGIHRMIWEFDDLSVPDHVTALRLTRNDVTINNLRSVAKGMNVIPGVPISLADALQESHRSISVWFGDDESTTLIIDQNISDTEAKALESFGALVTRDDRRTVISDTGSSTSIATNLFWGTLHTLLSDNDGTLTQGDIRLGIDLTSTSATLHGAGLLLAPDIDEPVSDDTVFSADVSGDALASLVPTMFTQNTPGLASLFTLAGENGISARLNVGDAVAYTFSLPLTDSTQHFASEESLTQLAKELVEVPSIDGITTFLDDGSRSTTLRSREEAVMVVRDDAPYRFITATSSSGAAYITQTPSVLTVSNHIRNSDAINQKSKDCLASAKAFIQPQRMMSFFVEQTLYQPQSLGTMLWHVKEIASTSSTTRICVGE